VPAGISGTADYCPQVQSGDLVGLAVSTADCSDQVPDVPTLVEPGFDAGDSVMDERFLQGEDLERLEADLAAAEVPAELRRPMRGRDVAEELAEVVEETSAVLLVIGLLRRSAVGKLLMGSAAQRILLDVECPILAVTAPPRCARL
jgi:nucleotide-binding universal stress UspA family protein